MQMKIIGCFNELIPTLTSVLNLVETHTQVLAMESLKVDPSNLRTKTTENLMAQLIWEDKSQPGRSPVIQFITQIYAVISSNGSEFLGATLNRLIIKLTREQGSHTDSRCIIVLTLI
jgi:hypothetical protein